MKPQQIIREQKYGEEIADILQFLDNIINEEKHIANIVTSSAHHIAIQLEQEIQKNNAPVRTVDGLFFSGDFTAQFNGKSLAVHWNLSSYPNIQVIPNNQKNKFNIREKEKMLYISLIGVNKKYNHVKAQEGIQHELAHYYEMINKKTALVPPQRYALYQQGHQAIDVADNEKYALTNKERDIKASIGSIIYLSNRHELTAYANGAYAYMMKYGDYYNSFDTSIQQTQMFQWLQGLIGYYNCIRYFGPYDKLVQDELKQYKGLTYYKILSMCTKCIRNYGRLLGQAREKAIHDYQQQYCVPLPHPPHVKIDQYKNYPQ